MPAPSEPEPGESAFSGRPPPRQRGTNPTSPKSSQEGKSVFQRIGWRRPSPDERRLWMIQGIIVLAAVLLIGTLMFLALR